MPLSIPLFSLINNFILSTHSICRLDLLSMCACFGFHKILAVTHSEMLEIELQLIELKLIDFNPLLHGIPVYFDI